MAQLPDPVGHWTFDEGDGYITADVSGNGNDGEIWNDGVYWSDDTPSGTGYSLEFTGKTGAVYIGDPDILKIEGEITLAAWIKTGPATENWQDIIAEGHGDNEDVLRLDGNSHPSQIWCGSWNGSDHMVASVDLTDDQLNTWLHVVGTYSIDYQVWTLYFNGEWVNEAPDGTGAVAVNRGWAIGSRAPDSTGIFPTERHFEGLIDDVRIYDVALSENEVQELYNQTLSAVKDRSRTMPTDFTMSQNYPNPFNPITHINYSLPKDVKVSLKVYDMLGREVGTIVNKMQPAGNYSVSFNASVLPSGIYIYSLEAGEKVLTRKMTLLK